MLKIIGCMMVFIASVGIGKILGERIHKRLKSLKLFRRLLIRLSQQIEYSKTPLLELLKDIKEGNCGCYKEFFEFIVLKLRSSKGRYKDIWSEAVEIKLDDTGLYKSDKEEIKRIADISLSTNRKIQLESINHCIEYLDEKIDEIKKNINEKTKVYSVVGITFGILIVIIVW